MTLFCMHVAHRDLPSGLATVLIKSKNTLSVHRPNMVQEDKPSLEISQSRAILMKHVMEHSHSPWVQMQSDISMDHLDLWVLLEKLGLQSVWVYGWPGIPHTVSWSLRAQRGGAGKTQYSTGSNGWRRIWGVWPSSLCCLGPNLWSICPCAQVRKFGTKSAWALV